MLDIQFIETGSIEIEYCLSDREDLPVLVFTHGLSANLRQFENQFEYFRKKYRVLLLSLRGHGKSGYPKTAGREDFTLRKMAEDCENLFDQLKIPAAHWVGNSMGGLVGYELLSSVPRRLLSLTTFGTTAELHYSETAVKMLTVSKDIMIKIMGYDGFARFAGKASSKHKPVQDMIIEMIMASSPEAVRYAHMNIGDYDYTNLLQKTSIPLFLIHCEHDKSINKNLKSTLSVLEQHQTADVETLSGAGHFANLDKPAEFNQMLDHWLSAR